MSTLQRPVLFWVLLGALALEFAGAVAVTVVLVLELLVAHADSLMSAIALTILAALAAAWMGAMLVGAVRGQAWIRGSAIVWQVLQFAVGIGAVAGSFGPGPWGWPLLIVAVATFGLLLAPAVVTATSQRPRRS